VACGHLHPSPPCNFAALPSPPFRLLPSPPFLCCPLSPLPAGLHVSDSLAQWRADSSALLTTVRRVAASTVVGLLGTTVRPRVLVALALIARKHAPCPAHLLPAPERSQERKMSKAWRDTEGGVGGEKNPRRRDILMAEVEVA